MKKKIKYYDAYFTVEASFIIPIAFLLIILMLYFGFFCYEKSVSLQCCYLAALRGSNEWELSGKELENYTKEELDKLLAERTLYPMDGSSDTDATLLGVEVSIDTYMEVPFSKIRGDNIDGWDMNSKKSAIRNIPSTYIRKYQMVKELGGENDGSNQQE